MANELVVSNESQQFMPVMAIQQASQRRDMLVQFVAGMMRKDTDFGVVPGTGDKAKPTLLKPGAEKLVTFFGLAPVFVAERVTEDFGDDGHEPLFFYRYRCELYRNGVMMGTGIGSCNSRESKYRYRNGERTCPNCGKATIIKGKAEYGGGWICFAKKGGCGAKFAENDPAIAGQAVGKVPNPDVADLVNTIDKMAQKRALIAAVLIAVNASEFFTQDVEDMITDAEYTIVTQEVRPTKSTPPAAPSAATISGGSQNVNGNGGGGTVEHTNGNGAAVDAKTMARRYQEAKDAARKSGKFGADKHVDNAWGKMFQEYAAHDYANGEAFLAAWAEYVADHAAAVKRGAEDVPSVADADPIAFAMANPAVMEPTQH